MFTVQQAVETVRSSVSILGDESIVVENAVGRIVAEDIHATMDFPPFDQSAMDGYAINGIGESAVFRIVRELKAGDSAESITLKPGEAMRIFTGAMLPLQCEAVVKQEDVHLNGDLLMLSKSCYPGENMRLKGEQVKTGSCVIEKYTVLRPGAVGFLLMLGIGKLNVFRQPQIYVLATGSELVKAGEILKPGQIHESNSGMLKAALQSFGFSVQTEMVSDNFSAIRQILKMAFESYDMIVITGGVSVGDYDFVAKVLTDLNVEERFYRVRQKPGKPIFFGMKAEKPVFGLPGNPAAVMTSFYNYVLPALEIMTGRQVPYLLEKTAVLKGTVKKSATLSLFLKGRTRGEQVEVMEAQSSAMLRSFVHADCLISLPEGITELAEGERVKIIMLPAT